MASVVQICNIALSRIGQSARIDSLEEQSLAAELCTLHYDECRKQVLRDFPWPFAEARVVLADIGSPPTNWLFRYRYPTDCLEARRITVPGNETPQADQRITFAVAYASGGRSIVSNQPQAELSYTVDVQDTTYFDPLFVSALAWKLAAELAMGLQARPENYQAASQNYAIEISKAQAAALEEGEGGVKPDSEFVTVRH